ncbi:glycoside hydrolase (plasmid) [Devosia sp. A8/3-2]|nr:glycoside hydrolase [Devosia sp. A8/3-2]
MRAPGSTPVLISWFYVSRDRAHSWQGPYKIGDFGLPGVSARTDIVPLSKHDALFMLTAVKANGKEGHVFAARTRDGGRDFTREGFVGEEPEGFGIMPASIRLDDGSILTLLRGSTPGKGHGRKAWIDQYVSGDDGATRAYAGRPVVNTGFGGNPPTLSRLPDGRPVMVYGFRDAPFGMRARVSADAGVSWGEDIILRDDGGMSDLGYPRTVVRPDGKVLTVYYYNFGMDRDRFIGGTLFDLE